MQSIDIMTPPAPPGKTKHQMLFQWTRSVILSSSKTLAEGMAGLVPDVDGFLVSFERAAPANAKTGIIASAFGVGSVLLPIAFEGERLRLIGRVWIGDNDPLIDQKREIRHWLECRERSARTDAAKAFFLDLDRQTLATVVCLLNPAGVDLCGPAESVRSCLELRLKFRAKGLTLPPIPDDHVPLMKRIASVMETCITNHFGDDDDRFACAFDRFAAGWLRERCPAHDLRLEYGTTAYDADSAYIFLFAEFVVAMLEIARREGVSGAWWLRRLNHFVRAQSIYLARWDDGGPGRLADYDTDAPVLQRSPQSIQAMYRCIGDDEGSLLTLMESNSRRLCRKE